MLKISSKQDSNNYCQILISVIVKNPRLEKHLISEVEIYPLYEKSVSSNHLADSMNNLQDNNNNKLEVPFNIRPNAIIGLIQPKISTVMVTMDKNSQTRPGTFIIERSTGLVQMSSTKNILDRNLKRHLLDIQLISVVGAGSKMKQLTINVVENYDKSPRFERNGYVFRVEGGSSLRVEAIADNSDRYLDYSIEKPAAMNQFFHISDHGLLKLRSGSKSLALLKQFLVNNPNQNQLMVKATGSNTKLSTRVVVKILLNSRENTENNNFAVNQRPHLLKKVYHFNDDANIGDYIAKIEGKDDNSAALLSYYFDYQEFGLKDRRSIAQRQNLLPFSISKNGQVVLENSVSYNNYRSYSLPIIISDGKFNISETIELYLTKKTASKVNTPILKYDPPFMISRSLGGTIWAINENDRLSSEQQTNQNNNNNDFTFSAENVNQETGNLHNFYGAIQLKSNGQISVDENILSEKLPNLQNFVFQNLKIVNNNNNNQGGVSKIYPKVVCKLFTESSNSNSIELIDKKVTISTRQDAGLIDASNQIKLGQIYVRNTIIPEISPENLISGTKFEVNHDPEISIDDFGQIYYNPSKNKQEIQFSEVKLRPRIRRSIGANNNIQDLGILNIDTKMVTQNMLENLLVAKIEQPFKNFVQLLRQNNFVSDFDKMVEIIGYDLAKNEIYFAIRTYGDAYRDVDQVMKEIETKSNRRFLENKIYSPIFDCQRNCQKSFGPLSSCNSKIEIDWKSEMVLFDSYEKSYLIHPVRPFIPTCKCNKNTIIFDNDNICRNPCDNNACNDNEVCHFRSDWPPWYRTCEAKDKNLDSGEDKIISDDDLSDDYDLYGDVNENSNSNNQNFDLYGSNTPNHEGNPIYTNRIFGLSKNSMYKLKKQVNGQPIQSLKIAVKIRTRDQIATVFKLTFRSINIEGSLIITAGKFQYYLADKNGHTDKKIVGLQNKLDSNGEWQDVVLNHIIYEDRIVINMIIGAVDMDKGQLPIKSESVHQTGREEVIFQMGNNNKIRDSVTKFVGCLKDLKLYLNGQLSDFEMQDSYNVSRTCLDSDYYLDTCENNCHSHGTCNHEWDETSNTGKSLCDCNSGYEPENACKDPNEDQKTSKSRGLVFLDKIVDTIKSWPINYTIIGSCVIFFGLVALLSTCFCRNCKKDKNSSSNDTSSNKRSTKSTHGRGVDAGTEFVVGAPQNYEMPERQSLLANSNNPSAPPSYRSDMHLRNNIPSKAQSVQHQPNGANTGRLLGLGAPPSLQGGAFSYAGHHPTGPMSEGHGYSGLSNNPNAPNYNPYSSKIKNPGHQPHHFTSDGAAQFLMSPTNSNLDKGASSVSSMTSLASSAFAMNEKMKRKKMNARNQIPAHQLGTNFSNNNHQVYTHHHSNYYNGHYNNQNNLHHYHQNPNRKAGPRSLPSYHNNNNFNQNSASYSGHSNGYNGQPRLGIGGKFSASSRQSINSGDEMSDVSYSSSQAQPIGQLGMPGIVSHSNGHAPVRQYSRSKRRRDPNLNLPLDSIKEQDAYPTNISKINSKQNVSNVTSRTESANEVHGRRSRKEDDKISDKLRVGGFINLHCEKWHTTFFYPKKHK